MAGPRKKPAVEKSGDNEESMELDQVRICVYFVLCRYVILFKFDYLGNSSRF